MPALFHTFALQVARCTFKSPLIPTPSAKTPLRCILLRSMSTPSPPPTSQRRHRSVVSSFLCTGNEGTPSFRVSVFKRSDKVRVYKYVLQCPGPPPSTTYPQYPSSLDPRTTNLDWENPQRPLRSVLRLHRPHRRIPACRRAPRTPRRNGPATAAHRAAAARCKLPCRGRGSRYRLDDMAVRMDAEGRRRRRAAGR